MRRVLVTGATGFIGRAVCQALLDKSIEVIGTVRQISQADSLYQGVVPVVVGDIGPVTDWTKILKGVDGVVHTAAHVHVMNRKSQQQSDIFRQVNVDATQQLAQCAKVSGVKRFVFLSTVKVCGEGQAYTPFIKTVHDAYHENSPCAPQNAYAQTKLEAEIMLRDMQCAMETVIVRPPLVYGPGVKGNFLRLLQVVDRGLPLPLKSVKNQRSMVCLGNLVSGLMTALFHKNAANRTFLISDGIEVSTPDLIRYLGKLLNRPVRLIPCPQTWLWGMGQVCGQFQLGPLLDSLVVDSHSICNHLNWSPPYTLEDGLSKVVRWYLDTKST